MRIRRRFLIPVAIAWVGSMALLGHPPLRVFLWSLVWRRTSRCFLLGPRGCQHADRVVVLANGRVLGSFGEDSGIERGARCRIVFEPTGETVFTFRITRDGKLLYEEPTFRAMVRQGDIFRCFFWPSDKPPTGYYGPRPDASFAALVEGAPAKVWCGFRRDDQFFRDRVQVVLRDAAAVAPCKRRAWWRGYRVVRTRLPKPVRNPILTLALPPRRTLVEAWLALETWEEVRAVRPEIRYVY